MSTTTSDDDYEDDWDGDGEVNEPEISELEEAISDTSGNGFSGTLPDGRSLALSGAGAGVAQAGASQPGVTAVAIRNRDQALVPRTPLFVVHRPHQGRPYMARLIASIIASTSGVVSVATSAALSSGTDASLVQYFDGTPAASIRMADPTGFLLDPTIVRV